MSEHPYKSRPVADTHEWLTPPEIIRALGEFDIDPCSPIARPWDTAARHFTADDDGLAQVWNGRVWMNPPYGQHTEKWLAKLAQHGDGIALVFARTETKMFFDHVWPKAHALLFLKGRPHFHRPCGTRANGNSGGPVVLIAYGARNVIALERCGLPGHFVNLSLDKAAA
jgi:hypothetical protein